MERCKTCKHWLSEPTKHDTFGRPRRGYCLLTESYEESPDHPDSLAIAHGGGCCTTFLVTTETFGCVQWQEREGMNTPETLLNEARALFHQLIFHPSRDHARMYRLIVKAERRKERRQGQLLSWYAQGR